VQFVVETASVANGFAVLVSPPQRRGGRFAIRTARPGSTGSRLQGLKTNTKKKKKSEKKYLRKTRIFL